MHSADPHSLYCHECGTTAEFGLRGSKEGGETRYLCSGHSRFNGCFCIDKDRAVWVQGRVQRRLEAAVARLEEELQQMEGPAKSPAESASCLPVWDKSNLKVALPSKEPMSHTLLAILLMIGCVESNPGPSSGGGASAHSASASVPPLSRTRLTPVESGGGDWSMDDLMMEESDVPSIEAESQGEDIEDVEFNQKAESSDEETSQDRAFRHDSPQPLGRPPVCEYAAMDAELWPSDTDLDVRLGGRGKRGKRVGREQSGEPQPRPRRRLRVIMSSSSEAEAEAEADESGSEEGGQSATSSEWGDLRNDDDPFWDWDDESESEELRQYFSVCRIDSRSGQERRGSLARQAVSQHGEPMAPVAATTAATAGASVRDASMSAATSALPTRASPRAAVQEPTPSPQARSQENEARTSTPGIRKTGRPASKRRKKAKANPVPIDEAARAAGRAAAAAHLRAVGALRPSRTQREGQAVHQTELGDFEGPPHAPPVGLVTDAPIPNVGVLVDRMRAKQDAEGAAAREERLKSYGRVRPLGAPRGSGDALVRTMHPSPSSPLPPAVLPSWEEDPVLSAEQTPTAAPSSLGVRAPPSPPADHPLVDADPGLPPSLSQPHEPPSPAGHPPSHPLADQPQEPLVIDPPPVENAGPEVVPRQPPAVAPSPSPAHQEQPRVDQALAPDLPNQPPAADTSQPTAAEPSAEPSSALPPKEPPASAVEDSGPGWCKKLEEALQQRRANGRAIVVAEDVHESGAKRWGSFRDVAALVAHRRSIGPLAKIYEVILDDACWRIYLDLDFSLPTEDPSDFERRLEAFHLVRDRFLTSVLNVPEAALHFQACEAHGPARPPKQGFKYSVHEVLEGFYLRGLDARRAFGKAFGSFLENPPNDLKASVELLQKEGGSAYMWDGSIYGRHRCFRLLRSSKFGDPFRSLVPSEGSFPAIADHLVCLYSEAEQRGSTEISADLLKEWATASPAPPAPARVGAFRQRALALDEASTSEGPSEDLSEQERAVLLARYQEDHAEAEIIRVVQERPGVFFVHFRAPEPTCCISGRRHASPGNQNPYLIYKRDEPRIARYQCFANSCRGECRVLPLDILTTLGWTEDYEENLRMRPYPVFKLAHVRKRTILVSAKKGVGKSKEFIVWLVAMVKLNPGVSFVLIGANISLSRKYHQDLVEAGVEGVVLYLEAPPGPITASRAVVCINSIHRVRAKMDVVAMDEMDMVLTNLNSEVMTQRGRVLSCLEAAMAGAKVVTGMDANIDCVRVMEYLFMARPDGVLHTIRNRGLYPAERRATIRVFPQASGSLECIGTAILDVLDRVARGTKVVCPSTSKRFVKHLEHHFNIDNPPGESDRRGIFLHADKRSRADEDFFQKAMADPDTYLEADLVAFSPKLGPGVSKEKPHAEETVAFALNNLTGPTVETLLQQHARFRTVTDSTIYYKQVLSSAVDLPRSTEAVFRAIERDDRQIVQMLGDASGFHFLRGSQGICDRSSASCVLYANNILAKVESYLEYVPKLKADLEKQGYVVTIEHIDPKGTPGRPPPEVPIGFDADPELLDDEDWRAKYIISSERYEILCERPEDLSPREQLQEYLYEMVTKEYKVDPSRVDHGFYTRFCADTDEAKGTKEAHANYLIFLEHRFNTLAADLDRALGRVNEEGVVQEYVREARDPVNRVPFAVRVLASLVDCREEELNHESEQWEVSEERVHAAYAELIGPTKQRLKTIFNLYGFKQQTSRPSKAADGRVSEGKAQKRNAVANVLGAGLGIELQKAAKKSGGKFTTPHMLTPAIYRGLHERYGSLSPEIAAAGPECVIRL